jgi:hypothetical protein
MAFPVIAWRTILRNSGALITASSTASGDFAATNVKDWRPYTLWKSGSLTSPSYIDIDLGVSGSADGDCLAVVNSNMVAEGGQLKVYADTVTPPTNVVQASYTPSSDACELKTFTAPGVKRYWRVEFNKGSPFVNAPYAGVVMLGLKMTMPEYIAPDLDPFLYEVEAMGSRTEGGNPGGVILRGVKRRGTMSFGGDAGLVRSFLTSDFNSFLTTRYKRCEPWVFQLDSGDSDFSPAYYLKKPDAAMAPRSAIGGTYARMTAPLAFEEAQMVAA